MKKPSITLFLILAFASFAQNTFAQRFPYHLYAPRTLAELNEMNDKIEKPNKKDTKNVILSAKPFYSAVRVKFTGKSRKLSKEKLRVFKIWEESLNVKGDNPKYSLFDLLDKEFLFKECDKEYWLPVQSLAANDFPKDLEEGDRITLYLMMVGGSETDGKWDYVYFVNSFRVY